MNAIPSQPSRNGMDRADMWQVIMSIGKPKPRPERAGPQARLVVLIILLGLSVLLAVAARGAQRAGGPGAVGESVQKGRGGVAGIQIPPLEKLEIDPTLSTPATFNFLQNFQPPVAPAGPQNLLVMSTRMSTSEAADLSSDSMKCLAALIGVILLLLWAHLISTRGRR